MKILAEEGRLRIAGGERPDVVAAFAEDVRAGLTSTPKRLSCRYFYDAEGSRLFDAICELPEYYLTRTEAGILDDLGYGMWDDHRDDRDRKEKT